MTTCAPRHTSRRAALLAVLAALLSAAWILGPAAGGAQAAEDPCALIYGPAKEFCERGQSDEPTDPNPEDCKTPPVAQRPDDGVQGYFAQAPKRVPTPIDPQQPRAQYHLYEQYGMAGLSWNNYDTGCVGDMGAWAETAAANVLMDGARWWTGLALEFQKEAVDGHLSKLNPVFAKATKAVREAVFDPWIGVSVLALGTVLIWQSRRRDLHASVQAAGWALLVTITATAAFSYPAAAGRLADTAITGTVGQIQQAVAGDSSSTADPSVAHGNLLHGSLLYDQWLRGELGSSSSKVAKRYGMQLYDAQTLSWAETKLPPKTRKAVVDAKGATWTRIAEKIKKEDPGAYGHLTGHTSGRIGSAVMAGLSVAPAVIFAIAVGAVLAAALLVVRFAVLFLPAIAPIALHRQAAPAMRTLGRTLGAALVHAPLFALAGAIDVLLIRALLDPSSQLPRWFAVILMWIVTVMLWRMARPFRSLQTLVSPGNNFVGTGIGTASAAGTSAKKAALGYAKSRLSARHMARHFGGAGNNTPRSSTPPSTDSPQAITTGSSSPGGAGTPGNSPSPPPPGTSSPPGGGTPSRPPGNGADGSNGVQDSDPWWWTPPAPPRPSTAYPEDNPTAAAPDPTPTRDADGAVDGLRTAHTPGGSTATYAPVPGGRRHGGSSGAPPASSTPPATPPPAPPAAPRPGPTPRPQPQPTGEAHDATTGHPPPAQATEPAGPPPAPASRPPHVMEPTRHHDGTTVYTIWTPTDGYNRAGSRDESTHRSSTPED